MGWQRQLVKIFGFLAGVIILVISASTSFGFFYTFVPGLIPAGLLSDEVRSFVSGLTGMILLDLMALLWAYNFRYGEDGLEKAVALTMAAVCWLGSMIASVTYLVLVASNLITLDAATSNSAQWLSMTMVVAAVVVNFGAFIFNSTRETGSGSGDFKGILPTLNDVVFGAGRNLVFGKPENQPMLPPPDLPNRFPPAPEPVKRPGVDPIPVNDVDPNV